MQLKVKNNLTDLNPHTNRHISYPTNSVEKTEKEQEEKVNPMKNPDPKFKDLGSDLDLTAGYISEGLAWKVQAFDALLTALTSTDCKTTTPLRSKHSKIYKHTKLNSTTWPKDYIFVPPRLSALNFFFLNFMNYYNTSSWEAYLSTSGLLLICGEAALAGEKLGLYRPDMAFQLFLENLNKQKNGMGKRGFVVLVVAEEKAEIQQHQ